MNLLDLGWGVGGISGVGVLVGGRGVLVGGGGDERVVGVRVVGGYEWGVRGTSGGY